jgi:hypothetical protein
MKKIYSIIVGLLLTANVFAQAPQKLSYQAVIRNSSNALISSAPVGMKISILHGSPSGAVVYSEIFNPNPITNNNGLVTVEIGGGVPVTGTFSTIAWANGPYFIQTETDPAGGTNYTITGTSQLLSVPYALHANTAETLVGGTTEIDPLWTASPSFGITNNNISNWNTAFSWGNHIGLYRPMSYVPSWSEITNKPTTIAGYDITDAMSISHAANGITFANISDWNAAFSWGNHMGLYRPMSYVPSWVELTGKPTTLAGYGITDAMGTSHAANGITFANISDWNASHLHSNTTVGPVHGSTTLGGNLLRLVNPSAIRFLRINADNSVSALDASTFRTAIGAGAGTVTSISTGNGITGGPITGSGSIGLTGIALAVHNLSLNGFIVKTGTGSVEARRLNAGTGIAITDGNGIFANPTIAAKTYQIGDFAHGGIVFWVDGTGQHGLVCAKTDQSTGVRWYAGTQTHTMARGKGPKSGFMNTAIIIANQGYGDAGTYAARICNELEITEGGKSYGDWYFPSVEELILMYENKAAINATATANGGSAFASDYYWSSSENFYGDAMKLSLSTGEKSGNSKSWSFRVRAVRAF